MFARVVIVVLAYALAALPLQATVFIRRAAPAGNCAGSPNFSNIVFMWTQQALACSTSYPATATDATDVYDFDTTKGDYPDAVNLDWDSDGASLDTMNVSDTIQIAPFDTAGDCSMNQSALSGTADMEYLYDSTTDWNRPGDTGSMFVMFKDTLTDNGGYEILSIGPAGDPSAQSGVVYIQVGASADDGDIRVRLLDESGKNMVVSTSEDISSGCCGGSHCDDLLLDTHDGATIAVHATWDVSTASDTLSLYIDGCLIGTDTTCSTGDCVLTMAATDQIRIGHAGTNNANVPIGQGVGMVAVSTIEEDLTLMISGGDDIMTDGDECHCNDYGGGSPCAG